MAARGIVWSSEETVDLIALWGDESVQAQLEGARHNHKVFARIAEQLAEKGYESRGGKQCQDKIRKMKLKYRSILDNNSRSGRARKTWEFFDQMNGILGTRPASRPSVLLQSAFENEDDANEEEDHENRSEVCQGIDQIQGSRLSRTSHSSVSSVSDDENDAVGDRNDINSRSRDASNSTLESEVDDIDSDGDIDVPAEPSTSTSIANKRKTSVNEKTQRANNNRQKKSKTEKAIDSSISSFTLALKEMDKTFLETEKERQRKEEDGRTHFLEIIQEMELKRLQADEKRRAQDREHELKMMSMMMNMISQTRNQQTPHSQQMTFMQPCTSDQRGFDNTTGSVPNFSNYSPYSYCGNPDQ